MRMLPNLEKHPTRPGDYIAYDADGKAFRCSKANPAYGGWAWFATPSHAGAEHDTRFFAADRLTDLATRIGKSARVFTEELAS